MVAGREGVPVVLFPFEMGVSKGLRIFEEHAKGLGELVVLLNEGLIIDLFQKRRLFFVLRRRRNKVGVRLGVEALLVCQHLVPDVAAASEGFFKQLRLLRRGLKTHLDRGVLRLPALPGSAFSIHPAVSPLKFCS